MGTGGRKTSQTLYYLIAASAGLLVLSLVFYVLGSVTELGDLPTHGGESLGAASDISGVDVDSLNTVTDDGTGVVPVAASNMTGKPVVIVGEVFTDRKKVADSFSKIQLALRIMPSENDESGFKLMKSTNEDNSEESKLGEKVDTNDNYFLVQETADYFPVFRLDKEQGPIGSALPLCVHIDWARYD